MNLRTLLGILLVVLGTLEGAAATPPEDPGRPAEPAADAQMVVDPPPREPCRPACFVDPANR